MSPSSPSSGRGRGSGHGDGVTSGLADLPGDRTVEVATRIPDPAEEGAGSDEAGDTAAGVLTDGHDDDVAVRPLGPVPAYGPSSTELSSPSRKARRRQRDRRAETRALQVVVGLFVGLGGLALFAVNVLLDDPPPSSPLSVDGAPSSPRPVTPPPPPPVTVVSSPFVGHIGLPALRQLQNEGLTIAAEGLPEVSTDARGSEVAPLAARESCRFAYGVWEFSPNKRFRFLPTCPSMDGQVLFGAYVVDGAVIRMSRLRIAGAELVSAFEVEKPSRLRTRVTLPNAGLTFEVQQRVTVIRAGLFGDGFFDTYAPKNTLAVPGAARRRPPPAEPRAPPPRKDPLLELLRGTKE